MIIQRNGFERNWECQAQMILIHSTDYYKHESLGECMKLFDALLYKFLEHYFYPKYNDIIYRYILDKKNGI